MRGAGFERAASHRRAPGASTSIAGALAAEDAERLMRCLTVAPGQKDSIRLDERPEPGAASRLARWSRPSRSASAAPTVEIIAGDYGWAPPGRERLVLGHESLGRVLEAPAGSGFARRRPGGRHRAPPGSRSPARTAPSANGTCAATASTPSAASSSATATAPSATGSSPTSPSSSIPALGVLGVLLEPTSVVAKAWDHIERIGARARRGARSACWSPAPARSACWPRCSAGSAASRSHVLDRVTAGPKPRLVAALGAHLPLGTARRRRGLAPDVVVECTGVAAGGRSTR